MSTEYKFNGSSDPSQPTDTLFLSGSIANPPKDEDIIHKGDVVSLSDDEVKAHRDAGLKFTKTSESPSDDEDESGTPDTRAEQSAQQASTAPKAGASATTTPSASAVGSKSK